MSDLVFLLLDAVLLCTDQIVHFFSREIAVLNLRRRIWGIVLCSGGFHWEMPSIKMLHVPLPRCQYAVHNVL